MAWNALRPMMVGIMIGVLMVFAAIGARTVGLILADIFYPDEEAEG